MIATSPLIGCTSRPGGYSPGGCFHDLRSHDLHAGNVRHALTEAIGTGDSACNGELMQLSSQLQHGIDVGLDQKQDALCNQPLEVVIDGLQIADHALPADRPETAVDRFPEWRAQAADAVDEDRI